MAVMCTFREKHQYRVNVSDCRKAVQAGVLIRMGFRLTYECMYASYGRMGMCDSV